MDMVDLQLKVESSEIAQTTELAEQLAARGLWDSCSHPEGESEVGCSDLSHRMRDPRSRIATKSPRTNALISIANRSEVPHPSLPNRFPKNFAKFAHLESSVYNRQRNDPTP